MKKKKKKQKPQINFEDLTPKEKVKVLKRKKKLYQKYLKSLQKIARDEVCWLNWLFETQLPYLRTQHAAYKRALRELNKSMPRCMGDTQGRIHYIEYEIDLYDRRIYEQTFFQAYDENVKKEK